jgi:hypothetical protein
MQSAILAFVRRLALFLSIGLIPLVVLMCLQFADENFQLKHTGPGRCMLLQHKCSTAAFIFT